MLFANSNGKPSVINIICLQGLLKVDDPEMKRTLDCYYEESSTEESDVASTSSDKSYEEVDSE